MKFGVTLRNLNRMPVNEARTYIMEVAKAADELGFYSVWASDHILIPQPYQSQYPYGSTFPYRPDDALWEPLTVLAAVSAITSRVRLGTSVLVLPLRHPIYTAKVLATMDCLSNGRVILGAGVGWLKEEMDIMGTPSSQQRGALTDEYLRIFKELWTKDKPEFSGRWHRFSGFTFTPKPVQKPHPPIWIGGTSEAALKRTVIFGDGWHGPVVTPDHIAPLVARLRQLFAEANQDFAGFPISTGPLVLINPSAPKTAQFEELSQGVQGNPDHIARAVQRYADVGATHFVSYYTIKGDRSGLPSSLKAMEVFAKEVMPRFA